MLVAFSRLLLLALVLLGASGCDGSPVRESPLPDAGEAGAAAATTAPAAAGGPDSGKADGDGGGTTGTTRGTTAGAGGDLAACARVAEAMKGTISIQEDLSLRPQVDFEPRLQAVERDVRQVRDAAVREAALEYVDALRAQAAAVRANDTRKAAETAEERIFPAIAALVKLCPDQR